MDLVPPPPSYGVVVAVSPSSALWYVHLFMPADRTFASRFAVTSYVHYYAIFFLGISEVSSVPLVFVDVFKFFPDVAAR